MNVQRRNPSVRCSRVFVSLLGCLLAPLAAQSASSCSCKDKHDLLNRHAEAKAAIAEYRNQIALHGAKPFSNDLYRDTIQPKVQAAINAVSKAGVNKLAGGTDPGTCERRPNTVTAGKATACLAEVIDTHEALHVRICQVWKRHVRLPLSRGFLEYRGDMSTAEALDEEMRAYSDEITFIKRELNATCPLGWRLAFDVTVSGRGHKTYAQDNFVTWNIKQKYSGSIDLTQGVPVIGPAQMALLAQAATMSPQDVAAIKGMVTAHRRWQSTVLSIPLHVDVDDEVVQSGKEGGEGNTFEKSTTTQRWKGSGKDTATGIAIFDLDEKKLVYDIEFAIRPSDNTRQVTVTKTTDIERSAYGWGKNPTHETHSGPPTYEPFKSLVIPIVTPKLDGNRIQYTKQSLKSIEDSFSFNDTLTPATPFLLGLPKDAVKVYVQYRLTRIEPN